MFFLCDSLSDLKPLENWNVSNATNLKGMFARCTSLKNRLSLKKWKIPDNADFKYILFEAINN